MPARRALGDVPNLGDITKVAPEDLPEVFMLMGGLECQPFSKAGVQLGLDDTRSDTWLWLIRALAVRQFPMALIENVEALLKCRDGRDWAHLKQMFAAAGYELDVQRDCASKWGYEETRKRVFITAVRSDLVAMIGFPAPLRHPPLLKIPGTSP